MDEFGEPLIECIRVTVTGLAGCLFSIDAHIDWTVLDLKIKIQQLHGLPTIQQFLCAGTDLLLDAKKLCDIATAGEVEVTLALRSRDEVELFDMVGMDGKFCSDMEHLLEEDPNALGDITIPAAATMEHGSPMWIRRAILSVAEQVAEHAISVAATSVGMPDYDMSERLCIRWPYSFQAPESFSCHDSNGLPEMEIRRDLRVVSWPSAVRIKLSSDMRALLLQRELPCPEDLVEDYPSGLTVQEITQLRMRYPPSETRSVLRDALQQDAPDMLIVLPHMQLVNFELGSIEFEIELVCYSDLHLMKAVYSP
eukprot:TRINITY_DN60792_c0_g1_i1.p1 TRINITY_DN60792_c0_g1~~TRINITY_DN60792_c0_g1_i1.p1  ORF type:complete len:310 (+),score=56.96 TRINITY_DN60792_c0_g1_i1:75-1004(+)